MSDNSGIFEELHAEREELERMYKVAKNVVKEKVILTAAPFFSLEEKEGKLLITGIALAEGIWKNVLYPAEEIEKSAANLVDKPLKVEHGLDENFKNREVGDIKKAYYDRALKSIVFQAEVTDPEAIKMVKDGTFPAVSCSTWVDKFPVNQEQSVGFNFNFNELSLVRTPACEKCFIFAVEELSKKIDQEKQDLNNQSPPVISNKEEINMTDREKEEVIEELEEEVDLSEMEKPHLYAVVEVDALTDFDETLAKKVVSYYYGYPHYYGYKGKYPYYGYPYYPYYPYYGKYPTKHAKDKKEYEEYPYKKPEKKSLWALLELESPEEIESLKKAGKKVKAVYYGYYGYPHYGYPYYGKKYYGYHPYYPYYGKKKMGLAIVENEAGEEETVEFDTMEELDELAKKKKVKKYYYEYPYKYKEKKAEEYKCPEGEVWDEKEKKCVKAPEEKAAKEEYKCPEGEVFDEKEKKCVKAPEEKAKKIEPYPCPEGTEWDPEKKECVEKLSEELTEAFATLDELALPKEYIAFMKKCMKESKTMPVVKRMKECAEAFKKQTKEEKAEEKCKEGEVFDEKEGKCVPVEKKEKYPAPEEKTSGGTEFTDMKPGEKIAALPGPAEQAAAIASGVKLSAETVKKEEGTSTPKVETPVSEPCEKCPEKEEEKKAEEPKVEPTPVVTPKAPKAEVKEPPKVEAPKEPEKKEEPKVEAPKGPTKEEIEKYVKEHWLEILHKMAKEKKL